MWDCRKTRSPNNWKGKGTKLRFQEGRDRGKDKNKMWRYSNVIAHENNLDLRSNFPQWTEYSNLCSDMCVMDILGIDRDRFG